jgi:hypothetical protein
MNNPNNADKRLMMSQIFVHPLVNNAEQSEQSPAHTSRLFTLFIAVREAVDKECAEGIEVKYIVHLVRGLAAARSGARRQKLLADNDGCRLPRTAQRSTYGKHHRQSAQQI